MFWNMHTDRHTRIHKCSFDNGIDVLNTEFEVKPDVRPQSPDRSSLDITVRFNVNVKTWNIVMVRQILR